MTQLHKLHTTLTQRLLTVSSFHKTSQAREWIEHLHAELEKEGKPSLWYRAAKKVERPRKRRNRYHKFQRRAVETQTERGKATEKNMSF